MAFHLVTATSPALPAAKRGREERMRGGVCGAAAAAAAWRPGCREGEREAPGWLTGTVSKAARRGTGQREREGEGGCRKVAVIF